MDDSKFVMSQENPPVFCPGTAAPQRAKVQCDPGTVENLWGKGTQFTQRSSLHTCPPSEDLTLLSLSPRGRPGGAPAHLD